MSGKKQSFTTLTPQPNLSSAGTAQQVVSSKIHTRSCLIEAEINNTGKVYIAGSESTATSTTGISLDPGEALEISTDTVKLLDTYINLSEIWFDGDTTGNKLNVVYLT